MRVTTAPEGLPLLLILDGRVQPHNLGMSGKDEEWLSALLGRYGIAASGVLIASLSRSGTLHVQDMADTIFEIHALKQEEVCW